MRFPHGPGRHVLVALAPQKRHHGSRLPTGSVSGEVELDLRGMRSGNPLVDREAERRLHVRRHPTVTGRLLSLEAGEASEGFAGTGELDFHGVTGAVEGTLRITPGAAGELDLSGSLELDVTDYEVQPPSLLLIKVHPEIRVDLTAVAVSPGR